MNKSSVFSAQRSTFFHILYCVLVRYTRTPNRTMHGKTDWDGSRHFRNTETLTFGWNIFPGFTTLQLSHKVQELLLKLGETPENFTGRTIFFRATSPLSRGMLKSKGGGKLSIHYCADLDTIKTVFRTISVNQISFYGAVAETCEEYESDHDRTEDPLWEISRVPHSCQV